MDKKNKIRLALGIGLSILLCLALASFFGAQWYTSVNGQVGFDAVLFTLFSEWGGTNSSFVVDFIFKAILPAILLSSLFGFFFFRGKDIIIKLRKRDFKIPAIKTLISSLVSAVLILVFLVLAVFEFGISEYIYAVNTKTPFFEEHYVKPTSENITFPEEKRNLIYIYLESMETTFFDKENGGAFEENIIPELFELANDNVNFSQNNGVGGALTTKGSTWTVAAMVSQTSGVPLKMPPDAKENVYGTNEPFLPGLTTLQNILADNGYYQALMVGSDGNFGGRREYYRQHGSDKLYDLYTALNENRIPEKNEWWGFDDKTLIEYAKEALLGIADGEKPFAFTMLTVDTHHVGGYKCELCGDKYEENYQNVYACSSKQISEFISWLTEQDFYENATIIITGDHQSMDNGFMERNVPKNYTRRIYNCIINPACDVNYENTKNRDFTTLDLFPTTLASIGCKIEGECLGLGTNLFSGVPTLCEKYGFNVLNREISNSSEFYDINFLGLKKEDTE